MVQSCPLPAPTCLDRLLAIKAFHRPVHYSVGAGARRIEVSLLLLTILLAALVGALAQCFRAQIGPILAISFLIRFQSGFVYIDSM